MDTHTDKTSDSHSNAVAIAVALQQGTEYEPFQLENNHPEIIAQRKIQEAANNSEQANQFKAVQAMVNNSTQVKQLRALQATVQIKQPAPVTSNIAPNTVVQRAWNVAEITRQKGELDAVGHFPGGAGGSALHHIISRDTMKKLSLAITRARENEVEEVRTFWDTVVSTTNGPIREQSHGATLKMLENIPLNLAYGPKNPLNDPGSGFDPDTVAAEGGARALSPVSAQLSIINDIIQNNSINDLGGEESGPLWTQANAALLAAIAAHNAHSQIAAPQMEQWLGNGNEQNPRFFRRGLYRYQNANAATDVNKFPRTPIPQQQQIGLRAPEGEEPADDAAEPEAEEFSTWAYATPDNVSHFLARHTYEYFTFDPGDIKLVNTFWPEGTTADNIIEYANAAFLYGQSYLTDLYDNKDEGEDLPGFIGIKNTRVAGIPNPVYLMFGVSEIRENVYELNLRTLAPDGAVDAYTATKLTEIRAALNIG